MEQDVGKKCGHVGKKCGHEVVVFCGLCFTTVTRHYLY